MPSRLWTAVPTAKTKFGGMNHTPKQAIYFSTPPSISEIPADAHENPPSISEIAPQSLQPHIETYKKRLVYIRCMYSVYTQAVRAESSRNYGRSLTDRRRSHPCRAHRNRRRSQGRQDPGRIPDQQDHPDRPGIRAPTCRSPYGRHPPLPAAPCELRIR